MNADKLRKKYSYTGEFNLERDGYISIQFLGGNFKKEEELQLVEASRGRVIAPLTVFDNLDPEYWEHVYCKTIDPNYSKYKRKVITGE